MGIECALCGDSYSIMRYLLTRRKRKSNQFELVAVLCDYDLKRIKNGGIIKDLEENTSWIYNCELLTAAMEKDLQGQAFLIQGTTFGRFEEWALRELGT